jgi:hypothetical protein
MGGTVKPGSKYAHLLHAVRKLPPGQVYVGTKGVDFDCEPASFQGVIYRVATERGGGWRATTIVVGGTVFYGFFKASDYMRPNLPACPVVKKARGEN